MFDVITRLDDDTFIASGSTGTYLGMIMIVEDMSVFKWVKLPRPNTSNRDVDMYALTDSLKFVRIEDPNKVVK